MNLMYVNTFSDLRGLVPVSTSGVFHNAKLLGYHSINDGGGGEWIWDNTSREIDDGATIVNVDSRPAGRWVRVDNDNYINIKIFGAKGDNITNDGVNIQRAINYCNEKGRVLYVPAGTYIINILDGNLCITIQSGSVSIIGDSYGKSIFKEEEGAPTVLGDDGRPLRNKNMFYFYAFGSDINYVSFENIVFDKSGSASPLPPPIASDKNIAFYYEQCQTLKFVSKNNNRIGKVRIKNCQFKNKLGGHITFNSGLVEKVTIDNCEFIEFSGNHGERGDIEFNESVLQAEVNNCTGSYLQSEPVSHSLKPFERISISNSTFNRLDMAGYNISYESKQYFLYNVKANINAHNAYVTASNCDLKFYKKSSHVFRENSLISNSKIRIEVGVEEKEEVIEGGEVVEIIVVKNKYRTIKFHLENKLKFSNCIFICDENDIDTTGLLINPHVITASDENKGYIIFDNCDFLDPNFDQIVDGYGRGNMKFKHCRFASKGAYCFSLGSYHNSNSGEVYRGHYSFEDCDFAEVNGHTFYFIPRQDVWSCKLLGSYEIDQIEMERQISAGDDSLIENGFSNLAQIYSDSKPNTGRWFKGDYIINTNPTNEIHGWRCVVSGAPDMFAWKEIPLFSDDNII